MSEIALIVPTQIESEQLRYKIHPHPDNKLKRIYEGKLHGNSILFTHCGVGKVNAAHSTTLILENYDVELMIIFGIAGAYENSGLKIGDVVVADNENYGEEGIYTDNGWKPMDSIGFELLNKEKKYYNTFPLDKKYSELAIKTLNLKSGNFVTVSQCSGIPEVGDIIMKRFNAICENMEGVAIVHICTLYGVPVIEIRGISNIIDKEKNWDISLASKNCNMAVSEFIKELRF